MARRFYRNYCFDSIEEALEHINERLSHGNRYKVVAHNGQELADISAVPFDEYLELSMSGYWVKYVIEDIFR